jgi:GNAT superfamily N-acetyltransferase
MSEPLADGYHALPPGKLAAVVTSLEMAAPAPLRPEPDPGRFTLRREAEPDVDWYRALFARMGRDWLWFSRLNMSDAELLSVIRNKDVQVYALEAGGRDEGLLELDFREPGVCELAFFAVSREVQGTGAGRWLMNRAIERAWRAPITRLWVHTCTLDHPDALGFYQRSGFKAFARRVEVADDPRLTGKLPPDAAPEVPIL